ncbi:hypothetical protein AB0L63_19490 [Nocardia sp. NPDC051990]|uniref:hypothetical protein n=1 Tax=Nocardia sp. NPDC051990 TaxID=3155285 RepID=UPI00342B1202
MARGVPRHIKGEKVRTALIAARPNGLSAKRLADVSGLSMSQVRDGLIEIREESALANGEPLTWSRDAGYRLSDTAEGVWTYTTKTADTSHTRLVRLMKGTVLPYSQREPDDVRMKIAVAQFNAAVASLQMVVGEELIAMPSSRLKGQNVHR